jgi:peptide deformylase
MCFNGGNKMIVKTLTQVGNPIIRRKSTLVKNIQSKKIQRVITDLTASMRHHGLVGIAATQIGINLRMFVTEVRKTKFRNKIKPDPLRIFINPRIVKVSKKTTSGYEGCGSVNSGGIFGTVRRPSELVVRAQDKDGKPFELKAKGLLARIILHELDHINGIVFMDKIDNTKSLMGREEYLKKFRKN